VNENLGALVDVEGLGDVCGSGFSANRCGNVGV
jgi:hypothetical protein